MLLSRLKLPIKCLQYSLSKFFKNGYTTERIGINWLVWLDMEMTGLDPKTSHILEVGCVITDNNLRALSTELNIVVHQPDSVLENMNEWCTNCHKATGLTQESRNSKITVQDAQEMTLTFLKSYIPKDECPIAGNTVYMDRLFLKEYMPLVNDYLHYKCVDVTSIAELARIWNFDVYKNAPKKKHKHRAISDLHESINELMYYKRHMFL